MSDLNTAELRDRAIAAARGDAPFDLLITGARVADVLLHELRPADIGIIGPMIASVHAPGTRSDAARVLDASGLIAAPGLIDTHMHVESSMITPETYAAHVAPRGVTTMVWDPHEFANVAGVEGLDYAADAAANACARLLPLVPSCVPSAPGYETAGADFDGEVIAALLARGDMHGLAEVMDMGAVISRAPRMRGILSAALESGKPLCGHARGLSGAELQAFVTAGIGSDHELTSAGDLMEKLRAGLWIELRGSHDHLLPEIAQALAALPQLPPTLTLCTDDTFPDDLLSAGGLDDMLRRMIGYGLPPLWALQAATYNAAAKLGRTDLGLIAPGRRADIVLTKALEDFRASTVLVDGAPLREAAPLPIPARLRGSMALPPVTPDSFEIAAPGPQARLASIDRPRFTQWGEIDAQVADGRVLLPKGATRIAVLHRHGRVPVVPRVGLLTGWGDWRGAFATTVSHDSHNLTVFGADPADMAAAANALIACGGGMAVATQGKVSALLPLPVAGLVSEAPLPEVAEALEQLRRAMDEVVDWQPPYLVFKALVGATLACNKGPHQTDLGIADPQAGRLLTTPLL
ncbi:adenine deaminase C-terminal domain-containing protein [Salipiger sp. 1_MG-2023]|uniref:adenine deaminase n=1 Tax=Salipiger sp. 1_MG-2023 TaxID=3062665 RepID=UPI0026E2E215|nr:adenine deaminase C-terminal domain-containing protein [Salipiger sp. 1_MG-2023]MDO6586080.1 adenine deaminase C-terminal domain-containing protein [Salipiger sp. 1_MG-2023]